MRYEKESDGNPLLRLYLTKRSDLVRFFTARTGSAAEAEDLVQEVYFKIVQADRVEVENGPAYLYRLGLNLMLDRYRSAHRRRKRDHEYHRATQVVAGGQEVSDAPSVEEAMDARRRLERLLAIVSNLPPKCRRVFQMHKLEGKTHSEVAAALGISRSAVEKHMINALRRLSDVR